MKVGARNRRRVTVVSVASSAHVESRKGKDWDRNTSRRPSNYVHYSSRKKLKICSSRKTWSQRRERPKGVCTRASCFSRQDSDWNHFSFYPFTHPSSHLYNHSDNVPCIALYLLYLWISLSRGCSI
jgi:hypothetical protein